MLAILDNALCITNHFLSNFAVQSETYIIFDAFLVDSVLLWIVVHIY